MRVDPELVELLADIDSWRLPAARWPAVEELLAALAAAVARDDEAAVARQYAALVAAAPPRIRIGEQQREPPPPPVRERVSRLVHTLTTTAEPPAREQGSDASR